MRLVFREPRDVFKATRVVLDVTRADRGAGSRWRRPPDSWSGFERFGHFFQLPERPVVGP